MGRRKSQIEEEWSGLRRCGFDEIHRPVGQRGKNLFQFPVFCRRAADAGQRATGHLYRQEGVGNHGDAVTFDEGKRRPVGNIHSEVFVESAVKRSAPDRASIDLLPSRKMSIGHLHRFFCGCRKEFFLIRGDIPVPAEMPLSNHGRPVAMLLEQISKGQPFRSDERAFEIVDDPALQPRPPVVATGEQGVTGWRTNRAAGVRVREAHPFRRQAVNGGSWNFPPLRVVAPHIAETQIVGQDNDHIRRACCSAGCIVGRLRAGVCSGSMCRGGQPRNGKREGQ